MKKFLLYSLLLLWWCLLFPYDSCFKENFQEPVAVETTTSSSTFSTSSFSHNVIKIHDKEIRFKLLPF